MEEIIGPIIVVAIVLVVVLTLVILIQPGLWFRALISGTWVSVPVLLRMRFKKLDSKLLVNCYIKARKSGVKVTMAQLEIHAQARGNVNTVVDALIAAHNAGVPLTSEVAFAVDLAGRDIKDAVKHNITPKVIETDKITAIAKDGIEMSVRAKITVRINLTRIIGGVLEETIIARVCEGIITAIGNANIHNEIIESPNRISKIGLDARKIAQNSAYDILSIDISDVEVGRNIGAELNIDEAEATKFVAQAEAEKRRSEALASEQEMRALTQEMRARVVAAEAELPRAIADAFARGNISVTDYYKMQNLVSDTEMRQAIASSSGSSRDALPAPKKKTKLG